MSDPIKKNEAEDVLSSIRRLVSAGQGGAGKDADDKLVLTSAQRIDGGTDDDHLSDTLERRIAELEAAVTAQRGEFEPDGSESTDYETPHGIDHLAAAKRIVAQIRDEDDSPEAALEKAKAEAADGEPAERPIMATLHAAKPTKGDVTPTPVVSKAAEQSSPAETVDAPVPRPADKNLLDDPALRDLISTIVREELQGELGERITRSVRKLVRREIQNALAARDFD